MSSITIPEPAPVGFHELSNELREAMGRGVAARWSDERFQDLALRAFRFQLDANPVYGAFCEARGRDAERVERWEDVPAVPVTAFKALDIVSGSPQEAEAVFRTSGTTRGETRRGRHWVRSLELYRASLLPPFQAHVVPDVERIRFVSLIPSPQAVPDSSLSYMVGAAADRFASRVRWVVGPTGELDEESLADALGEARRADEPVLLLGTAFALLHALERDPSPLASLPPGSRIMETGGFKGRTRAVPKAELHALLADRTRVPRERIVNEYGMTELLSQLYEPVLQEGAAGADVHRPPPWLRVRALDPTTLEPRPEGEEGILAFMDLANLGSVCHILTEDVGVVSKGHVRLLGRTPGAEPRGCSRAMDELMSAAG